MFNLHSSSIFFSFFFTLSVRKSWGRFPGRNVYGFKISVIIDVELYLVLNASWVYKLVKK